MSDWMIRLADWFEALIADPTSDSGPLQRTPAEESHHQPLARDAGGVGHSVEPDSR